MPIHPTAKKVFSGIIFDVYHWEQELFDGTTATFERLKRPNRLSTLAIVGDKILLTKEQQPAADLVLGLPGGRQDPGEDLLTGAQRELLEETGYASDQWESFLVWRPYHKIDFKVHLFLARDCQKIAEPHLDPGEQVETVLYRFDEFLNAIISGEFCDKDLSVMILRMMHEPEKLEEFRQKIFKTQKTRNK